MPSNQFLTNLSTSFLNFHRFSIHRKELKQKYNDKLTKELSGPTYEVLGKVMKAISVRKLTGPGGFVG